MFFREAVMHLQLTESSNTKSAASPASYRGVGQLVPRLFIRCNKLSPEICFRVEAPNSMLQVKITTAPVRLRPREHRGRRSASRRVCGWRRIALSLSQATLLSVEALLHQDGCEKIAAMQQQEWFLAFHSIAVATAKPNTGRPTTPQRCHP